MQSTEKCNCVVERQNKGIIAIDDISISDGHCPSNKFITIIFIIIISISWLSRMLFSDKSH